MSSFLVKLDGKRPCRYVFTAKLWEKKKNKFGIPVNVLLDTGSFNTIIHEKLVERYGVLLDKTMKTSVGGYKGDVKICILNKIKIGNLEIEILF